MWAAPRHWPPRRGIAVNRNGCQPEHTRGEGGGPLSSASERWNIPIDGYDSLASRVTDESMLIALAGAMQAATIRGITAVETSLLRRERKPPRHLATQALDCVREGGDPLGEAFCKLRPADVRRTSGAVYTPRPIIDTMFTWAASAGTPTTVVDPGAGSGRFLAAAARCFPSARLVGIENDPVAALVARANLAAAGLSERAEVRVENFLQSRFGSLGGPTLFIGNPPYVRHHLIPADQKAWLKRQAEQLGVKASALAGLHAYFFLAIARNAKNGDFGSLVTSAEWLDVNYGRLVRELFLGRLGGQGVFIIDPGAQPFPGTATTGAITTFKIGSNSASAYFGRGTKLPRHADLSSGRQVDRQSLRLHSRWSDFSRTRRDTPAGYIELGELCRVHRGQVTGANRVWIAGRHSEGLPDEVLFPTVTKARELFGAGAVLSDGATLRRVIDVPADLSMLDRDSRPAVERFLQLAEDMGARDGYIARHRQAWWSVRLHEPAPVLATYMARRPPAFVLNKASARHLNIAHGLYPREPLSGATLGALVAWLRKSSSKRGGREYAGGLTKFEPREMERIPVPGPALLSEATP